MGLDNAFRIKIVLTIFVLLLSVSVSGTDLSGSAESILGEAAGSSSIEKNDLSSFRLINDRVVLVQGTNEDRSISVLDAGSMEQLWLVEFPFTFFYASDGSRPVLVLTQVLNEAEFNIRAYDLDGALLFAKDHFGEGEIMPSPNGDYFYTTYSQLSRNRFQVFDREGEKLFELPRTNIQWDAASFNDDVLAYFVYDTVKFLEASTGSEIKSLTIPVTGLEHIDKFPITPTRWLAKNGDRMIISWHGKVTYIDSDMEIGWDTRSPYLFLNAAFSDDNRFAVLYRKIDGECQLDLVRTTDGAELWDEPTQSVGMEGTSEHPDVVFSGEYIRVLSPQTQFLVSGKLNDDSRTFLFKYDRSTGNFVSKSAVEGAVFVRETPDHCRTFSVTPGEKQSILIKDWKNVSNER